MAKQHALSEIKHNIKHNDLIKARLVMDHLPEVDKKDQNAILDALLEAENEFAVQVLCYLLAKYQHYAQKYPLVFDNLMTKSLNCPHVIIKGISRDNLEKRTYIRLAGELNLQSALPTLLDEMLRSQDKIDQFAILETLGALSNPDAIEMVTEFLYVEDLDLLTIAIQTLGQIGTHEAIRPLARLMGKGEKTDRLILDVFAIQQTEFCLIKLNEALRSPKVQIRNYARDHLVNIGAKGIPLLIDNLFEKNVDHQIISLSILQIIGDESTALAVRKLINQKPAEANVRFAAYETLAAISNRKGDYVLANGLVDLDGNVRMAASIAIDKNLDNSLVIGVVNMVERAGEESEWITKAVIDAAAVKLFEGLLISNDFVKIAVKYLSGPIHEDIRTLFLKRLKKAGKVEEVARIQQRISENKREIKGNVCAVDDSKMILNIYRSIITELGYEPFLFEEPAKALEWLQNEKPDYLCSDLNMPEITGIELIKEVRKLYSKQQLPIFLVTTQDQKQDNITAREAGATEIIQKPFNTAIISELFKKFGPKKQRG
ncbi:MAG: response regulator [Proteobacteria bacterium]|nr:response regulator [Pseudomonadota bacterium]